MLKNRKIIYNYLSNIKIKNLFFLAIVLMIMILLGIAGVYFFQGPPADFQPQFTCEAQPFTVRLTPDSQTEFSVLLTPDTKAKITKVVLGSLPENITAEILPATAESNTRKVKLQTNDNPQIGSFSIAIFFTERLYRQDFTTNCQFNLIVE